MVNVKPNKTMKTEQSKNTETQTLNSLEVITIDGGVYGEGGCIPNPLDKLVPQLPMLPTEQTY